MFGVGDIPAEAFFAEYWRQRPVLVKGAARSLADVSVDAAELRILCDRLERARPGIVRRRGRSLFGQYLDLGSPELARISDRYKTITACTRVWFDGVIASEGEGLGAHYDHSDNFVMQQEGVKRWRLGPPDRIPQADLHRRMLDDPEAGGYDMPDDAQEFILEPGDVLYIPLFWGHDGVSVGGPSTSLSLVLNADTPLDVLLPAMRDALKDDEDWWRPLPARMDAAMEARLGRLAESLGPNREQFLRAWRARLGG
ncbi:MAG: cupin domain-containing protein [Deltaproteobacteria bacterium]